MVLCMQIEEEDTVEIYGIEEAAIKELEDQTVNNTFGAVDWDSSSHEQISNVCTRGGRRSGHGLGGRGGRAGGHGGNGL